MPPHVKRNIKHGMGELFLKFKIYKENGKEIHVLVLK
jgi:hypothetical protein